MAAVGTTYDLAKAHVHDLGVGRPAFQATKSWSGYLQGIMLHVTSIAGGAASLTVRVTLDAAGDYSAVPDVTVTLATGITTATTGCAAIKVQVPLFQILGSAGNSTLYVHVKTDAGTVTLATSCLTWSE
tara:strand:+ start:4449 stop:4835 length:387 start_codon:yes stop_codon:yes gene_type:complete